jgi:hypothetical protein
MTVETGCSQASTEARQVAGSQCSLCISLAPRPSSTPKHAAQQEAMAKLPKKTSQSHHHGTAACYGLRLAEGHHIKCYVVFIEPVFHILPRPDLLVHLSWLWWGMSLPGYFISNLPHIVVQSSMSHLLINSGLANRSDPSAFLYSSPSPASS